MMSMLDGSRGATVTPVRVSALQRVSHADYSLLDAAEQVVLAREPCLFVYRAAWGIKTALMAGCIRWSVTLYLVSPRY